jgi:amino acid adenylation domain-containing protein
MSNTSTLIANLPPEQQAIRAKCFHPTGTFVEFEKEEVERSIPQRFEKIARMFPNRPAVRTEHESLTYAELNETANRLARIIVATKGSEPGPIALCFGKGAAQFAAMMGVLKAGKFFVPLDPSFPKERLAALLEDSQAQLVITDGKHRKWVEELLDADDPLLQMESMDCNVSTEDLGFHISPNAFSCIIYTSGSTGRPKGVLQNHRSTLLDMWLRTHMYHISQYDRIALLSTANANAVVNSILALLDGAALFPFDVQSNGVRSLADWLLREEISICRISAPLFRNFCESLTGNESFPDLRLIHLASDSVYAADIALYKKHFSPRCILTNGLGSAEAYMLATYWVSHETELAGDEVPIGYSFDDKEILLDDAGNEVGFNRIGEICVRSDYISPGYWRRPELTVEKFKRDPRGSEKTLYLTGDLALRLSDGCLIHKGRKDYRVKIRGSGVDITEVESALRGHRGIKEAIVVSRQDASGEPRLITYFTCGEEPRPSVAELRRFLKAKLADYMIPSAFVCLRALPLATNGKIDRRLLPDPGNSRPELDAPYVAPRTPIEEQLVQIWSEVLLLDRIGIHDNFFDLGGHSLAATRVVSHVIKNFQLEIPLQSLFQSPTVAEMAAVIAEQRGRNLDAQDLAGILTELESLTDEQAQKLLSDQSGVKRRRN